MIRTTLSEKFPERKFCNWCDKNDNILRWASEEFSIPYLSPVDHRVHRYFPDYLIEVKEKGGKVKKYVVEVKPKKQQFSKEEESCNSKLHHEVEDIGSQSVSSGRPPRISFR